MGHHDHSSGEGSRGVHQTLGLTDSPTGPWTPARYGDFPGMKKYLERGGEPNLADSFGNTPLHYAARAGFSNICNSLVSAGASVNSVTKSGKSTALHGAAAIGSASIVKLLLRHGASAKAIDDDGKTPLHKAAEFNEAEACKLLVEAAPETQEILDKKCDKIGIATKDEMRHSFLKVLCRRSHLPFVQERAIALSHSIVHGREATQPPLLMIHGLLGNKNNFNFARRLLQAKLPDITIISCDVRNHGTSPHSDTMDYLAMSEDILELLQHLNINKCTLMGHSLGGRIAMQTALTEGSKIHKLIVVDVSPGVKEMNRGISKGPIKYIEAMKQVRFEHGLSMSETRKSVGAQLAKSIPEKSIRDLALTNLAETSSGQFAWRVNIDAVLQNSEHLGYLGHKDKFTAYNGQTLFLGGETSDYITSSDFPDITRLFPNAIIKHIPDCGHWVHADKPELFAEHVTDFISNQV